MRLSMSQHRWQSTGWRETLPGGSPVATVASANNPLFATCIIAGTDKICCSGIRPVTTTSRRKERFQARRSHGIVDEHRFSGRPRLSGLRMGSSQREGPGLRRRPETWRRHGQWIH